MSNRPICQRPLTKWQTTQLNNFFKFENLSKQCQTTLNSLRKQSVQFNLSWDIIGWGRFGSEITRRWSGEILVCWVMADKRQRTRLYSVAIANWSTCRWWAVDGRGAWHRWTNLFLLMSSNWQEVILVLSFSYSELIEWVTYSIRFQTTEQKSRLVLTFK